MCEGNINIIGRKFNKEVNFSTSKYEYKSCKSQIVKDELAEGIKKKKDKGVEKFENHWIITMSLS